MANSVEINIRTIQIIGLITLAALTLTISLAILDSRNSSNNPSKPNAPIIAAKDCVAAFRDGGGPYYLPNAPFREQIAPEINEGEKLVVEGYIWNESCDRVIPNAILDIWQASEEGEYEDEYYRGQVRTDEDGYYRFETVMPLGYGEGTAYRPPHIHFKVHIDGTEIVTSQMFFEDVRGRAGFTDQYIIDLNENVEGFNGFYNIILPDFE